MESLRGPIIDPSCIILGENNHPSAECYNGNQAWDLSYGGGWGPLLSTGSMRLGDRIPNLASLQMLEEGRTRQPTAFFPSEPNLPFLFALQKQQQEGYLMEVDSRVLELESCVTHASETQSLVTSELRDGHLPLQSSNTETASPEYGKDEYGKDGTSGASSTWKHAPAEQANLKSPVVKERKKRKRSKPSKNMEEVESQRMTHIAVERNRRKQMNEHLDALRALMPASFIRRGDQASIVGGAIDFVKELEQLWQSLQGQKRRRRSSEEGDNSPDTEVPFNGFFVSPQYRTYSSQCMNYKMDSSLAEGGGWSEFTAENKSTVADIEVTLIQSHANLKVLSRRRPGQLLKALIALEELDLAILHLNITTVDSSVLYSFNLKIEEGCKLRSADEIATAVHHMFSYLHKPNQLTPSFA